MPAVVISAGERQLDSHTMVEAALSSSAAVHSTPLLYFSLMFTLVLRAGALGHSAWRRARHHQARIIASASLPSAILPLSQSREKDISSAADERTFQGGSRQLIISLVNGEAGH